MINLCQKSKFEKRCNRKVQNLYNIPAFGIIKPILSDLDRQTLESIISVAKDTALLLASFLLGIRPTSFLRQIKHLNTKLIAVLAILYRSVHRNNSNYLPLFVTLYLYFAGARIDVITLLNHLKLSVLYNVLQKKLKAITFLDISWIRQQSTNCKLVGR